MDPSVVLNYLFNGIVKSGNSPAKQYVEAAITDSYERLIAPSVEREIRNDLFDDASRGAIVLFSENLRHLLMQAPIKGKVVLGGSGSAEAGTVELYDANNVKTMTIDNTGLQFIRTIGSHEYKSMYGYMAPPINGTYVINGLEFLEDGALTASVELQSNSRSGGAFMFRILSMTSAQVYGEYNLVLNTGGRLALSAGDDLTINGTVAYTGWAYPDDRIRFINGIAVDVQ
jgi:hypothetical protein